MVLFNPSMLFLDRIKKSLKTRTRFKMDHVRKYCQVWAATGEVTRGEHENDREVN